MSLLKSVSLGLLLLGLSSAPALAQDDTKPAASAEAAAETAKTETSAEPTMMPRVKLTTTLGDIVIELDGEKAPISTQNFLGYVEDGFYKGTIFHRVMPDFMIQGGGFNVDMDKKAKEGDHKPILNEWENGLKNKEGTIAMARLGGQADSATDQFFINVNDNDFLDVPRDGAGYAVFGKVVEGMDVVKKIENTPVVKHPKYPSPQAVTPETPVVIEDVKLLDKVSDGVQAAVDAKMAAIEKAKEEAAMAQQKELEPVIKKYEEEFGGKFQTTDSGLMYLKAKEGTGASPKPTDEVEVNYWGKFLDGEQFDSSYDRGQSTSFPLNRVIAGWTEGVGMMKEGGKWIFIIPSDLAYGDRGRPGMPGGATLVFQVELIKVK
ncbi:peptidylprolyl isomerase [bacterium]|nr:peptidylprolyl isomerase [bacterium]